MIERDVSGWAAAKNDSFCDFYFFKFQWKIKSNSFAVRQLHMEFLRAGSDVMQTFTFSASEDNMESQVDYNVAAGGEAWWEEGSSIIKIASWRESMELTGCGTMLYYKFPHIEYSLIINHYVNLCKKIFFVHLSRRRVGDGTGEKQAIGRAWPSSVLCFCWERTL